MIMQAGYHVVIHACTVCWYRVKTGIVKRKGLSQRETNGQIWNIQVARRRRVRGVSAYRWESIISLTSEEVERWIYRQRMSRKQCIRTIVWSPRVRKEHHTFCHPSFKKKWKNQKINKYHRPQRSSRPQLENSFFRPVGELTFSRTFFRTFKKIKCQMRLLGWAYGMIIYGCGMCTSKQFLDKAKNVHVTFYTFSSHTLTMKTRSSWASLFFIIGPLIGQASALYNPVREYSGSTFFDRWTYYGTFDNTTWGEFSPCSFFFCCSDSEYSTRRECNIRRSSNRYRESTDIRERCWQCCYQGG